MNLDFVAKFNIEIDGEEYDNTFKEDISIDRTCDLDEEFSTYPAKLAYYSMLYELAKDNVLKLKRKLELKYALVESNKRQESIALKAKNPKMKYTEKMYENETKTDPEYQEAELEYLESKKTAGLLGAAREAMLSKRDMLISMGANARVGANSELRSLEERARSIIKKGKEQTNE